MMEMEEMTHASTRMVSALALCAATALALGCGDDDRPSGGGTDSGPAADTGAAGGMCTFGPTTMDGCAAPSDQTAVEATDLGPEGNESLADIAGREGRDCALAGMSGDDLTNCVRDALVSETDGAVSGECATCYGVSVTCSATNCLSECLGGPSADCDACRCGANDENCDCVEQFTLCSGVPSDTCM